LDLEGKTSSRRCSHNGGGVENTSVDGGSRLLLPRRNRRPLRTCAALSLVCRPGTVDRGARSSPNQATRISLLLPPDSDSSASVSVPRPFKPDAAVVVGGRCGMASIDRHHRL